MKIVHIVYSLGLGGIETMLVNIANEQVRDNEVHIIVINNLYEKSLVASLDKNVHFHCLKRTLKSKSPIPVLKLNLLLMSLRPDIIHMHTASIAMLLLPVFRKRLCATLHDVIRKESKKLKYLYKARKVFAISNVVNQDLHKYMNIKSEVVCNGIKPELINHNAHIGTGVFRIVQISRLDHLKKGQHILIKAVRKVVDDGYKNVSLDLIGEGESMEYLNSLVGELGLDSHVHFLGAKTQSYIFEHLHEYDLFVQPSIFEGFGLTVAEAMAAKIPVLVSENQGPLEIIDNGKYGYSFKNQDVDDCAEKLEMFLNHQNDSKMVEYAYKRVCECYNVKITAETYLAKYKELLAAKIN